MIKGTFHRSLIAVLASLMLFSPAATVLAQPSLADWTILIYLDGDNNLERDAIDDFIEMAAVGSDANVHIVVQFDRLPGYDTRYGDWTGTLRFRITQGMTPEPANALADLGEANMGDPQTLVDFVEWGQATFPAQRTALVLWNHGDGWRLASFLKQRRKAICLDTTSGGDALDLAELRQALAAVTAGGAAPLDLLSFDACLMAMIEVDAQIQPYVRVRTASEETEPGTGYPFDTILADLQAHPEWEGTDLGIAIVERYHQAYNGETQSAIDLGGAYPFLVSQVDALAAVLLDRGSALFDDVHDVRREVQQFYTNYVDLYDLAELLAAAIEDQEVQQAAQDVMDAVDAVTLRELHGGYWPGAHGTSIYFPAQSSGWDSAYSGENDYLSFTADTRWDEYLITYLELATDCTPDGYEPDDSPDAASAMGVGAKPQRHNFCPVSDNADWVSFVAAAGQTIEITTSDLDPFCDTVVRLYDTDGQTQLAQDDDSGEGWASRIEWVSPASGTYYLRVSEYFGRSGQDTGYTLSLQGTPLPCDPDAYEPDNLAAQAGALLVDAPPQQHNFCPQEDLADWMAFQGAAGQTYEIATSDLQPNSDTVLTLFNADGSAVLLVDDDGGDAARSSRLRWTCSADGPYLVRVHEKQGRTGVDTGYRIGLSIVRVRVRGQASLQGRATSAGVEIAAQAVGGAAPVVTTTLGDGSFVLTTTTPCTVTASYPGYLPVRWAAPETEASQVDLEPRTLLGGDINADQLIDILDLAYIGARFGGHDPSADINEDGNVDILDLVLVATNFGQSAGAPG